MNPSPLDANPAAAAGQREAVTLFLAFALVYFLSALLRAVTATLAPVFSVELGIGAADLGLLAGAYFLGFAAMQLPLGRALDRHGPRRVLLVLLAVAVIGCAAFALARSLGMLVLARACIGVGVSAGLMAPLSCFRARLSPVAQLRANSWMLMTGSLGMLASTLPVQWLLPWIGWRGLFWAVSLCLALSMWVVALRVPGLPSPAAAGPRQGQDGYGPVLRHPLFLRMAPLGFFVYGGMVAIQALWAGPWLTQVAGWSSAQAAGGLFVINSSMLLAFLVWGAAMPRLAGRGLDAVRLMTWGLPFSLVLLALNVMRGADAAAGAWALWCVASTFVTLSQPAVGQAFPASQSGKALSAFNLVIFSGVFVIQWGLGWIIDATAGLGASPQEAFRVAFSVFGLCCLCAYLWFLHRRH